MRIAFHSTIPNHPWGGADTLWTRAAEAASERGDEILLSISPVTADNPRIAKLIARGARLEAVPVTLPPIGLRARALRKLRSSLWPKTDSIASVLARWRPDLLIISCGGTCDLAVMPRLCEWLLESQVPFRVIANFQEQHLQLNDSERERVSRVFEAAQDLCFVSTQNLRLTRQYLLLPLSNAKLLHNPLRWQPGDTRPWPPGPPWHLATVSRLSHNKGIHLFLHALAEALPKDGSWSLDIHGSGSEENYLRSVSTHLGLDANVRFMGHVGRLASLWESNHLLASPAIDEGVPMTIPEAMLCGRPVLATRVGGAEDWLRDSETGFLCPAATVPLLAETLSRAWRSRQQWQAMGMRASESARLAYRPDDFLRLISIPFSAPHKPRDG